MDFEVGALRQHLEFAIARRETQTLLFAGSTTDLYLTMWKLEALTDRAEQSTEEEINIGVR